MLLTSIVILIALSGAVSLVSGSIALWEFVQKHAVSPRARNILIGGCLGTTVLFTLLFTIPTFSSSPPSGDHGKKTDAPTTVSQRGATITPSLTPLPTPTPSPTPEPKTYTANWSNGADGWGLANGWKNVNGMLVNDGSDYNNDGHPTAIAPSFAPDHPNYSVQVEIRLDRYGDEGGISGLAGFGVVVRSPDQVSGYKLGVCASAGIYSCGTLDHALLLSNGSFFQDPPVKQSPFRPPYGSWHTYRIDVQGNTLTVYADSSSHPLFQVTDNKFLSAGSIGLWSDRSQISVRNFTITAL